MYSVVIAFQGTSMEVLQIYNYKNNLEQSNKKKLQEYAMKKYLIFFTKKQIKKANAKNNDIIKIKIISEVQCS